MHTRAWGDAQSARPCPLYKGHQTQRTSWRAIPRTSGLRIQESGMGIICPLAQPDSWSNSLGRHRIDPSESGVLCNTRQHSYPSPSPDYRNLSPQSMQSPNETMSRQYWSLTRKKNSDCDFFSSLVQMTTKLWYFIHTLRPYHHHFISDTAKIQWLPFKVFRKGECLTLIVKKHIRKLLNYSREIR